MVKRFLFQYQNGLKLKECQLKKKSSEENFDYVSLNNNNKIKKIFDNYNEIFKTNELYSDDVNVIKNGNKITTYKLIITNTHLYFLEPSKLEITIFYNRNDLYKISISEKNSNLICLHFNEGNDIIVETLRRLKLLRFFRKKNGTKKYIKFMFSDIFELNNTKNKKKKKLEMINTIKIHLLPNFEEAIKFGYLNKLTSKLGVKKFIVRFVVLTNVGLFDYENPGKNPKNFVSLINCKINSNLLGKYKLSFVFEIVGINDDIYTLACESQEEMDSWITEIKKIKTKYQNNLRNLDVEI